MKRARRQIKSNVKQSGMAINKDKIKVNRRNSTDRPVSCRISHGHVLGCVKLVGKANERM